MSLVSTKVELKNFCKDTKNHCTNQKNLRFFRQICGFSTPPNVKERESNIRKVLNKFGILMSNLHKYQV